MSKSEKPKCKYHSYDTFPAKVFFDIRETKNYQLMRPKPGVSTAELEAIFQLVYDEYFIKMINPDAHRYLELRNQIAVLICSTETVKMLLEFVFNIPSNLWEHPKVVEMRNNQLANVNSFLDTPIDIEADILDEYQRVLNVELGIMENDLAFANVEIEEISKRGSTTVFNFYRQILKMSNAYGRTLDEKLLLPMYVEAENELFERSKNTKSAA